MSITLDTLRRFAVDRTLFPLTTLKRAVDRLGFIQADPIRAPARAQDLILRQRVRNYRAGDLERGYVGLGIEEDVFINYGFVTPSLHVLMHPRSNRTVPAAGGREWPVSRKKKAQLLLKFVQERGLVHPREADEHFSHGSVKNFWGGSSNATTQLLEAMHYRGMLRVVRRESGIRVYAAHVHGPGPVDKVERQARIDKLVDAAICIYAPLPSTSLSVLLRRLRYAIPQWRDELTGAIQRAKQRLSHASVEGVEWYWPQEENPGRSPRQGSVRLLAPFDPLVWDRTRFELLWDWAYRFEAYTPGPKRKLGYYALPMLWRDRIVGWGNLSVTNGDLAAGFGYIGLAPPGDPEFPQELEAELNRVRVFLGLKIR